MCILHPPIYEHKLYTSFTGKFSTTACGPNDVFSFFPDKETLRGLLVTTGFWKVSFREIACLDYIRLKLASQNVQKCLHVVNQRQRVREKLLHITNVSMVFFVFFSAENGSNIPVRLFSETFQQVAVSNHVEQIRM